MLASNKMKKAKKVLKTQQRSIEMQSGRERLSFEHNIINFRNTNNVLN
jgi:hypothetical protein